MSDFYGYTLEEVDDYAESILETLDEVGGSPRLQLLALCRAIVRSTAPSDLDLACLLIDTFNEVDEGDPTPAYEEEDEDEDG